MQRFTYAAMLGFVVLATIPLELIVRTRVLVRLRRMGLVLLCVGVPFVLWDLAAVRAGHWEFDVSQTVGLVLPGGLPLEEWLFFVVVPVVSVMTLEAVRSVRGWSVGDEPEAGA